jgi:class 3 adenylate cyclase
VVRQLAAGTRAAVVFVDYKRSPEARYPVPIEQDYAVTKYVAKHPDQFSVDASRLAIAGDSVGGNMTAVVSRLAKERQGPAIKAQVLFYPVIDAAMDNGCYPRPSITRSTRCECLVICLQDADCRSNAKRLSANLLLTTSLPHHMPSNIRKMQQSRRVLGTKLIADKHWRALMRAVRADETAMAHERIQRRLAAILAADVVGYSALMERAEEATYAEIGLIKREVIEPRLAQYQGRLIKTMGDGMLAEFASPVAAVRCAVEIQDHLSSIPDALELRIGLNLGDVIVQEDGDVYGEGINMAARLEGIADPSGILVSSKVHREVEGKLDLSFEDRGECQLKNISKSVRAYDKAKASDRKLTARVAGKARRIAIAPR